MTALLIGFALALPVAAAYVVSSRLLPGRDGATRLLRAGIALPLGLGAASVLSYAWLVAGGALGRTYAVADAVAFSAALAWAWTRRAREREWADPVGTGGSSRTLAVTLVATGVALGLMAVPLVRAGITSPHGEWDAIAIWNLRARFLLRAGSGWHIAFDPALQYSHTEYPLLLPTAIARLWAYSGETTAAPALVAGLFTLSPVLVIMGAVSRRASVAAGAAAALVLAATPGWVFTGGVQYADVPLACYVAAGVACLVTGDDDSGQGDARLLGLAGLLLGFGAWTKNEGIVLGAIFGTWGALRPGTLGMARRVLRLGAGALVPFLVRVHFQVTLAPQMASDFALEHGAGPLLGRLLDAERLRFVGARLPRELPGAEYWLPIAAVGLAVVLGARWRGIIRSAAVPAVLSWGAFFIVYAVSPQELGWHIGSSASRVLLQPWPALLLGLFAIAPRPGGPLPLTPEAPPG